LHNTAVRARLLAPGLLFFNRMKTVAAILPSRSDAERAAERLRALGVAAQQLTVLSPGSADAVRNAVPTDEGEAQGTGAAIGAVVGGATGAAAGMPLGAAISLMVPGIGPVIAFGLIGAALFSAGGAAVGSALENTLSHGVPRDDVFIYEDALRQGRSVVVALVDDELLAERARAGLLELGGVDVDAARDEWWAGLREQDRGVYTAEEEMEYRRGFEAALVREEREPSADAAPAFRRGWERGRAHRGSAAERPLRKSA
jgi:hypothetical protein